MLDSDLAIKLCVGGAIDLAHAALAELGGDAIMSESLADHAAEMRAENSVVLNLKVGRSGPFGALAYDDAFPAPKLTGC